MSNGSTAMPFWVHAITYIFIANDIETAARVSALRLPTLPPIPQLRLLCRSETSMKSLNDHQTLHLSSKIKCSSIS